MQDMASYGALATGVSSLGFATFMAWYLLTRTVPNNQKDFTTALINQQLHHKVMAEDQRTSDREQAKEIRKQHSDMVREQREAYVLSIVNMQQVFDKAIVREQEAHREIIELVSPTRNILEHLLEVKQSIQELRVLHEKGCPYGIKLMPLVQSGAIPSKP